MVLGLWSGLAAAEPQGGAAKVAPFPLQIKQAPMNFSKEAQAELQAEYVKMLRETGVESPSSYEIKEAITRSRRQDCDVEDQCLAALAVASDALYSVHVSLEWDVKDTVTASGRVVRQDGELSVPRKRALAKMTKKDGFAAAARQALKRLIGDELQLTRLPATRPTPVVAAVTAPTVDAGVPAAPLIVDAGVATVPPQPPPPPEGSPLATVGTVVIVVGAAAAVTGAILFGLGSASSRAVGADGAIVLNGGETPEQARGAYRQALVLQPAGLAVLGAGAGVAVIGAVLLGVAPKPVSKVALMPVPGGGGLVSVEGVFP